MHFMMAYGYSCWHHWVTADLSRSSLASYIRSSFALSNAASDGVRRFSASSLVAARHLQHQMSVGSSKWRLWLLW